MWLITAILVTGDSIAQGVSNYLSLECPTILSTTQLNAKWIFVQRTLGFCVVCFVEDFQELGGSDKDYV